MAVKVRKKESRQKAASKRRKVTSKSKKIDWDKYVGKIEFPVDAVTHQQKARDEWVK